MSDNVIPITNANKVIKSSKSVEELVKDFFGSEEVVKGVLMFIDEQGRLKIMTAGDLLNTELIFASEILRQYALEFTFED